MTELVDLRCADHGVATITLQHGKVNALSVAVLGELADVATAITTDPRHGIGGTEAVRAVVISGGPRVFAAGADITEFTANSDPEAFEIAPADRVQEIADAFLVALGAVAAIPVPTIASVSGFALGGGLELALACDLRVASAKARFGLPEILLGIIPGGGGTQRLARLVGPAVAKSMVFTGRQLTASEAASVGLVDRVVEPEELDAAVEELAAAVAAGPPSSMRAAKAAIDGGLDLDLAAGLLLEQRLFVETFTTTDAQLGVSSFLQSGPGHADFGPAR